MCIRDSTDIVPESGILSTTIIPKKGYRGYILSKAAAAVTDTTTNPIGYTDLVRSTHGV